jgi:hypothetical protein
MSPMQAVARPSALPVLKSYQNGTISSSDAASSPENDSAPSPVYDRQRRAGSTPTRTLPGPGFYRSAAARNATSTTAIPSVIHNSSLANNNNNNNKLKTQTSQTSISSVRSNKIIGTESPKEGLSRRHSARAVAGSASNPGRNPSVNRSVVSENNPSLNSAKVVVPSSTNNTNTQKSNLARCSITRAIITKLQPNTSIKTKGTLITS